MIVSSQQAADFVRLTNKENLHKNSNFSPINLDVNFKDQEFCKSVDAAECRLGPKTTEPGGTARK